ncbi:MAG: hypothetical protein Q4E47_01235 [Candidatus Saccharibacteria bacterium]|nr:hypothetical protein [Candidatus Saccharibacteria bacterium]
MDINLEIIDKSVKYDVLINYLFAQVRLDYDGIQLRIDANAAEIVNALEPEKSAAILAQLKAEKRSNE